MDNEEWRLNSSIINYDKKNDNQEIENQSQSFSEQVLHNVNIENQTITCQKHCNINTTSDIPQNINEFLPVENDNESQNSSYNAIHSSASTHTPLLSAANSLEAPEGDLDFLKELISKYTNNPSIGYLNINSLRGNKFDQLNDICKTSKIDILCIDETKLSSEIPSSRIHIDGYRYPPLRRDREQKTPNSFGGGKVVHIREGAHCKSLPDYETKTSETICLELSLRIKK